MSDHELTIRAASLDDLSAVDALLARSFPKLLKADYLPSVLVTALPLISRAQPDLLQSGRYYVGELGGQVVAAGGWSRDRRHRTLGHIRHLVSDDRYLRRGHARAVIAHTLRAAGANGICEMECHSTLTAVAFYEAMGFEREGAMQMELRPGVLFPAEKMRLRALPR